LEAGGRNVKTRTALLLVVVGIGAFVVAEIRKHQAPFQTPATSSQARVAHYANPQVKVEAEPTPADPVAKQRAIDAELNRAIKRVIDVER
jgi:hypothetical protein